MFVTNQVTHTVMAPTEKTEAASHKEGYQAIQCSVAI